MSCIVDTTNLGPSRCNRYLPPHVAAVSHARATHEPATARTHWVAAFNTLSTSGCASMALERLKYLRAVLS